MTDLFVQVRKKLQLEQQQKELQQKKKVLEKEVFDLKIQAHNAQAEADAMGNLTVKGLLLKITGKYHARLEFQHREAERAKANFDSAAAELDRVSVQLAQITAQLPEYINCAQELSSALADRFGHTPCAEVSARVLELTQLLRSGDTLTETGRKLHKALTDVQAYTQARQPAASSYGVPSAVALQEAIGNAQKAYRECLNLAETLCQRSAAQGLFFDPQALLALGPDYLNHLHMVTVIDGRAVEVQNTLTRLNIQWKALRPQAEEQLYQARMAWMHALCQYDTV